MNDLRIIENEKMLEKVVMVTLGTKHTINRAGGCSGMMSYHVISYKKNNTFKEKCLGCVTI